MNKKINLNPKQKKITGILFLIILGLLLIAIMSCIYVDQSETKSGSLNTPLLSNESAKTNIEESDKDKSGSKESETEPKESESRDVQEDTRKTTVSPSEDPSETSGIKANTESQEDDSSATNRQPAANHDDQKHYHEWKEITEQQWISDGEKWVSDGQKWVVDQAAWSEQVRSGSYIQCSCGATFNTVQEWDSHNMNDLLNGGSGHSYSTKPIYSTVAHPEQGHYEDTGHYESVGHYETVTIGYKCDCGATK